MIPTTPVTKNGGNVVTHRLDQSRNGMLRLVPSGSFLFFCLISVLLGAAVVGFATYFKQSFWLDCLTFLVGCVFIINGSVLAIIAKRFVFERGSGEFRRQGFPWESTIPFDKIVGVQVIDGGRHKMQTQHGGVIEIQSYELNLILTGDEHSRVNLTNHSDLNVTRHMATQIAEFLSIPAYDSIAYPQVEIPVTPDFNKLLA